MKDVNAFTELVKSLGVSVEQLPQICEILEKLQEQSERGGTVQIPAQQSAGIPKKTYIGFVGGDISEVTGEDDFKNDELYQSLYAQGISTKLRRTMKYDLKKKAQEIGKRELAKYFQERCEEKEAEIRNANELKRMEQANGKSSIEWDKKTEYTDLPENCTGNKYIGVEWIANNDKVYTLEQHGDVSKVVVACMQPVLINRRLKPLDGIDEDRKVELQYQEDNYCWKTLIVNLEELLNANKAVGLSSRGIIITKKNAVAFSEFMASMYHNSLSRDAIPVLYTVKQLGWADNNKYFMPFVDSADIIFDRKDVAKSLLVAFKPVGDKKIWYVEYVKLRKTKNMTLKVFTAAMFASPILALLNMDGFAVDIFGTTTTGKTTTMQMAASIWGDCDTKSDLIVSPKSTPTALELRLGVLNNIPLIFDDTAVLKPEEKVAFQSNLMLMANGKSKDRGQKDLSLQESFNWKTIIVFTSEGRIDKDWTTGGSRGRVITLENEEKPEYFDNLDELMEFFENNYGHAGRDFVEVLQKIGIDKVKKMYNGFHKILRKAAKQHGKMSRHAANVAFLVTADRIAEKYLFHDGVKISLEEAIALMSDEKEIDQPSRFYNNLIDTVYQNAGKIEGLTEAKDIKGEYWGIYIEDDEFNGKTVATVSFIPKILNQLAKDADMDVKLFITYLKKNHLLKADKGRNQTKEKSEKLGKRIWVVKIILPDSNEESKSNETLSNGERQKSNENSGNNETSEVKEIPEPSEVVEPEAEFVEPLTDDELKEMGFPLERL